MSETHALRLTEAVAVAITPDQADLSLFGTASFSGNAQVQSGLDGDHVPVEAAGTFAAEFRLRVFAVNAAPGLPLPYHIEGAKGTINVNLPDGVELVSATTSFGTIEGTGAALTWNLATLDASATSK